MDELVKAVYDEISIKEDSICKKTINESQTEWIYF